MNATEFFKETDIGKKILENIIDAEFNASIKPNCIVIGITFRAKHVKHEIPAKISIPLEVPRY